MDADLQFALHIRQMFPTYASNIRRSWPGRDAFVLLGSQAGQPSTQFCFDKQSGLLVQMIRYADSPLGLDPSQVDYVDYRAVDGVQVPFRVTVSDREPVRQSRLSESTAIVDRSCEICKACAAIINGSVL